MRTWPLRPRKSPRIEIIPMIDVMMFLLVFFVLISLNALPSRGLKVALPYAADAAHLDVPKRVTVTLAANGDVYLDGRKPILPSSGAIAGVGAKHQAHGDHRRRSECPATAAGQRAGCVEKCGDRLRFHHRQAAMMSRSRRCGRFPAMLWRSRSLVWCSPYCCIPRWIRGVTSRATGQRRPIEHRGVGADGRPLTPPRRAAAAGAARCRAACAPRVRVAEIPFRPSLNCRPEHPCRKALLVACAAAVAAPLRYPS